MKALRWILFCLVAFGLGTGVAFAMHPPTVGIPKSDAADLAGDLSAIKKYAAAGHCSAVRGRLSSASRTIADLPSTTNANTESQLTTALERVRSAALATCEQVAGAAIPPETTPTTPATTPATTPQAESTPTPSPEPTATPDAGGGDQPTSPSGGVGTDGTSPDSGGADSGGGAPSDGGGGITLPNGEQVPGVNQLRHKIEQAQRKIQKALNH